MTIIISFIIIIQPIIIIVNQEKKNEEARLKIAAVNKLREEIQVRISIQTFSDALEVIETLLSEVEE